MRFLHVPLGVRANSPLETRTGRTERIITATKKEEWSSARIKSSPGLPSDTRTAGSRLRPCMSGLHVNQCIRRDHVDSARMREAVARRFVCTPASPLFFMPLEKGGRHSKILCGEVSHNRLSNN